MHQRHRASLDASRDGARVADVSPGKVAMTDRLQRSSGGAPLPDLVQAKMGAAFGADFSGVRVHQDGQAESIGAQAYARGDDLHFAAGRYAPASDTGMVLIAHELAHVVQQREGRVGGEGVVVDAGLEREADELGARAAGGEVVASSGAVPAPAQVAQGKGIVQLSPEEGTAVATEAPAAPAAAPIDDGGDYKWILAGADFECVGTPAGMEVRLGFVISAAEAPDAHARLKAQWDRRAREAAPPPAEPAPTPAPAEPAPPAEAEPAPPASSGGIFKSFPRLTMPTAGELLDWFWPGGDDAPPELPPECEPDPIAEPEAPGECPTAEPRDTLEVARELADKLKVPHTWDEPNVAGDPTKSARKKAIVEANEDLLKTIVCSEFTALTLAEAGHDLTQLYEDPASGLQIGYTDCYGKLAMIDLYMVTNNQWETTAALLEVQNGDAERVTKGSARATELGGGDRKADFWYSTRATFEGMEIPENASFGAGATAVALGGKPVAPEDRRPGDLQQRIKTKANGTQTKMDGGHSSQVYSVRGPGVCWLDNASDATSPLPLEVELGDSPPGWYEIADGEGAWEIGPDVRPDLVASLKVKSVQLIDANTDRAGGDATGVGGFEKAKTDGSEILSDGRLPTSKWFDWTPRTETATKLPKKT